MKLRIFFLNCFLFINPWIWQIYHSQFFIFITLISLTNLVYFSLLQSIKPYKTITLILFIYISFLYYKTTLNKPLLQLSPIQIDLQQKRLTYYPILPYPFYKLPRFLESNPLMLSIYKIKFNLTNIFDPNYYYYRSHPRSTQTPGEFLKFYPITFLFLLHALINFPFNKHKLFTTLLLFSILTTSFIGDQNHLGIFPILPFFIILTTFSFNKFLSKLL